MQDEPTRIRISLLAFDETASLWRAAHDLVINGFKAGQFCLFGLPTELAALELQSSLSEEPTYALTALLSQPSIPILASTGATIEMRCGPHAAELFAWSDELQSSPAWIKPELGRSLASDIAIGRIIFLVVSHNAGQHTLGARLLLRHGHHDLETYEFSVPRSAPV